MVTVVGFHTFVSQRNAMQCLPMFKIGRQFVEKRLQVEITSQDLSLRCFRAVVAMATVWSSIKLSIIIESNNQIASPGHGLYNNNKG